MPQGIGVFMFWNGGKGSGMEKLMIAEKPVALFSATAPGAPLVVLNGEDDEGEAIWAAVKAITDADFSLAAIGGLDWDDELTPWPAPGIARGRAFGGGADDWLATLTEAVVPQIIAKLPRPSRWVGLAGYSLAGLFAVYALYRTNAFARIASASGSLWYPGFAAYADENDLRRAPERAYLSVGEREALTKNPALRAVEEVTRRMAARLEAAGELTRFELNPGGHFNDPVGRMAKGIAWLLEA